MSVDYPEPLIQEQQAASTRPDHVYQGVTIISDPTQWLPTPQNLKQNLSLVLLLSGYICQTVLRGEAYECYPCEFDIFSERSKILGSEL